MTQHHKYIGQSDIRFREEGTTERSSARPVEPWVEQENQEKSMWRRHADSGRKQFRAALGYLLALTEFITLYR